MNHRHQNKKKNKIYKKNNELKIMWEFAIMKPTLLNVLIVLNVDLTTNTLTFLGLPLVFSKIFPCSPNFFQVFQNTHF